MLHSNIVTQSKQLPTAVGAEACHQHQSAMTTPGCCHLPGSLCDYSGSTADLPKEVEEPDAGQAQYVAKVTAKDGRPLSTVVKAMGSQR